MAIEMDRISLVQGDITDLEVDAIVNAANSSLMGGGGVDGAIHRTGGRAILGECEVIARNLPRGGLPTGEAVITTGGKLPAKHVIHTVGPVWVGGFKNEEERLASCYRNSLRVASENGVRTIAFPGISTGIYRFPKEPAARIAIREVRAYLADHPEIERVVFVAYDRESYDLYECLLAEAPA